MTFPVLSGVLRMTRPIATLSVVTLALACGEVQMEWQRTRAARSILRATDLANVPGADGGMTAQELVGERPALAFIPYAGYGETVDSASVTYRFNARDITSTAVDPKAHPERISLERRFVSEQDALTHWRSAVQRVIKDHAKPTSCWTVPGPTGGHVARWVSPSIHLELAVRRPIDVGPEVVPDRVVISAEREAPVHIPGSQVPCRDIVEVVPPLDDLVEPVVSSSLVPLVEMPS